MLKNMRALWDGKAAHYSEEAVGNFRLGIKHRLLQKWSRDAANCLDVGIADGIYSIELARREKKVFGVDISPAMLQNCRDIFQKEQLAVCGVVAGADCLPFKTQKFDLAFSFATLAIVPRIDRAFAEIWRTLKPGGVAILDITGKYNLSQRRWNRYYRSQGHFGLHAFSLPEIRRILEETGFDILEIHPMGFLDQWKYIPGLHKLTFLEKICHLKIKDVDLDYVVSKVFQPAANHWYVVARKKQ